MLADISASCKQSFRVINRTIICIVLVALKHLFFILSITSQFDSFVVPLEFNLTQYGYWNDRNGGKQIFWAGPATSSHTCQCGIENNCAEREYKCNADALAPLDVVDEGINYSYFNNTHFFMDYRHI